MDNGEHGAEATFNRFAAEHVHHFEDGFNDPGAEQKLEFTEIYNQYRVMLEQTLKNLVECHDVSEEQFGQLLIQHKDDP